MRLGLEGRVALVVGGSRGIGRAVVDAFVAEGARVVAVARDPVALAAVAGASGCDVVPADVSTVEGVETAVAGALALAGAVDCLVPCQTAAAAGASEAEYAASFATDLMPAVRLLAAVRAAQPARPLAVCTIASVDGLTGATPHHAYSTMKAALVAWTKNAAVACGGEGTRVNAVSPGVIATPLHDRLTPRAVMESMRQAIPMARIGVPDECVGAYLYFASDKLSGYVTGQVLEVNGGQLMA